MKNCPHCGKDLCKHGKIPKNMKKSVGVEKDILSLYLECDKCDTISVWLSGELISYIDHNGNYIENKSLDKLLYIR